VIRLVTKKTKTKEWFTIVAPKLFDEKEIGKTTVSDPKNLPGRKIILSLMEVTNDFSKYYMKFIFKITRVEGNRAFAEFSGSECMRDYISRMILRRVRRIDAVQDLTTKDGIKIRVKSLAIISRRIKSSIQKNIRAHIKEMMKEEVENSTLDEFIEKIISDEIKGRVLRETRQAYPVRNFEIRKTEIL
jgi:small subunit ribosomal protein S3Ae